MNEAISGAPGRIAARQAGAGFGGCMVALVKAGKVAAFAQHVQNAYQTSTGMAPHVFSVLAAQGAGPVAFDRASAGFLIV